MPFYRELLRYTLLVLGHAPHDASTGDLAMLPLAAAAQALKLEYNLGQRWLERAEAGTTSAIGLFFRWAFD